MTVRLRYVLALVVLVLLGIAGVSSAAAPGSGADLAPDASAQVAEPPLNDPVADGECVRNGGEDCRPVWFEPRDEVGEPPWIL